MFVDFHAVPPNDPKKLCGRISYPVFFFTFSEHGELSCMWEEGGGIGILNVEY